MQNGKYGVDLVVDGNVIAERVDGTVAIPFGKDYAIRLRNDDHRRAIAMIYVDEVNVSGDGFVVNGKSSWSVQRPHDKAVTFRVASSQSVVAAEHGKAGEDVHGEKGLIRVEWRAELYRPNQAVVRKPFLPDHYSLHSRAVPTSDCQPTRLWKLGGEMQAKSLLTSHDYMTLNCAGNVGPNAQLNISGQSAPTEKLSSAVTVEGKYSNQSFVEVETGPLDQTSTTIRLKIMGYEASQGIPISGINYCPQCRTKTMKATDKFCRSCGYQLITKLDSYVSASHRPRVFLESPNKLNKIVLEASDDGASIVIEQNGQEIHRLATDRSCLGKPR